MDGQEADAGAPDEREPEGGNQHGPGKLGREEPKPVLEAPDLVRLGGAVQEHEPADDAVLGLRDEADGTHGAFLQIPVDEYELDVPGDDALDNNRDTRVTGEGFWIPKQPDWLPYWVLMGVHSCG